MSFSNGEFQPNDVKVEFVGEYVTTTNEDNVVPDIPTENNYYQDNSQGYQQLPSISDFYHSNYSTWNNFNTENNIYSYSSSYSQNNEYSVYSSTPSYCSNNQVYNIDRQSYNYSNIPSSKYTTNLPYQMAKSNDSVIQKSFLIENLPSNSSFYQQVSYGSDSTGTEKSYSEGRGDVKYVKKRAKKR